MSTNASNTISLLSATRIICSANQIRSARIITSASNTNTIISTPRSMSRISGARSGRSTRSTSNIGKSTSASSTTSNRPRQTMIGRQ